MSQFNTDETIDYGYSKTIYLFLYFCFLFNGWSLNFIPLPTGDMMLILMYLYLIFGYWYWSKEDYSLLSKGNLYYFWFVVAGICLSMIPAMLYHNQPIDISITTYRAQYLWFALPVLLKIAPTEEEVVKACTWNLFVMCGVYLCKLFYPAVIVVPEDSSIIESSNVFDVGYVSGFIMAIFPLYYYWHKLQTEYKKRYIFYFLLAFLFLMAMSNRTNLFAAVIILGLSVLKSDSNKKFLLIIGVGLAAIFGFYLTESYWMDLFSETLEQTNDTDYNRNKAFLYFTTQGIEHPLTILLGNGFLSSRSSTTMADLMNIGIFNSDMGFIGFWNQFGIIPIIAFVMIPVYALFDKRIPMYVKYLGAHILLCAYSTSYYGSSIHAIIFILIYYLLVYNKTLNGDDGFFLSDIIHSRDNAEEYEE